MVCVKNDNKDSYIHLSDLTFDKLGNMEQKEENIIVGNYLLSPEDISNLNIPIGYDYNLGVAKNIIANDNHILEKMATPDFIKSRLEKINITQEMNISMFIKSFREAISYRNMIADNEKVITIIHDYIKYLYEKGFILANLIASEIVNIVALGTNNPDATIGILLIAKDELDSKNEWHNQVFMFIRTMFGFNLKNDFYKKIFERLITKELINTNTVYKSSYSFDYGFWNFIEVASSEILFINKKSYDIFSELIDEFMPFFLKESDFTVYNLPDNNMPNLINAIPSISPKSYELILEEMIRQGVDFNIKRNRKLLPSKTDDFSIISTTVCHHSYAEQKIDILIDKLDKIKYDIKDKDFQDIQSANKMYIKGDNPTISKLLKAMMKMI